MAPAGNESFSEFRRLPTSNMITYILNEREVVTTENRPNHYPLKGNKKSLPPVVMNGLDLKSSSSIIFIHMKHYNTSYILL